MEYRKLSDLKKLDNNPRQIKEQDLAKLIQSIRDNPEYFEARPLILSNRTGELIILGGNQRYEASKFLKLEKVPTHLIEGLTEEKEREIIIRDNVNNGSWDFDLLANEWDAIDLDNWGLTLWGSNDSVNSMDESDVDTNEEFDPVGNSSGQQKIVITFNDTEEAESWIERFSEYKSILKKQGQAWQINLCSQSI